MSAEGIQQTAMRRGVEKPAIVRLAMYLDEIASQVTQERDPDRFVVQEGARAAIAGEHPAQDDFAIHDKAIFRDKRPRLVSRGQIENRRR